MVAPPSPESIRAAYENATPECIHVANRIARIRDRGSDGDASLLPPSGEAVPLSDGTVDVLQEADPKTIQHWLDKIGNYLVYEGDWHSLARDVIYTLKRFPLGYKLYTHLTGPIIDPRRDSYLYGSTTDRCTVFRSPEEFVLHAKWLAFGKPRDELGRALCGCRYCSRRPQGEISEMLREKVSHLNPHSSGNRPTGSGHSQARSRISDVPIIAKDYTQLNQGGGVSVWVENAGHTRNAN